MAACTLPAETPLVEGLMRSVDCNVSGIVESGYAALVGPASPFQAGLTILLTLYIAFFGFRLLLGLGQLRFGELTISAAKIGIVLALATSWPAYQKVVVDVLYAGPQDLAARILGGGGGTVYAKLQVAFDQMQATADYYAARSPASASPFIGGPGFGAFSMNASSMITLLSTVGVILASKIVLTALLAFGPVFIALFLFESTRGLFVGWLRAAILFAVAPLFALVALVFQLLLVEPQLLALAEMRAGLRVTLAPAIATMALTGITATVSLAGLVAIAIIATGFKLPRRRTPAPAAEPGQAGGDFAVLDPVAQPRLELPPRAAAVAAAAMAMDRRESRYIAVQNERLAYAGADRVSAEAPAPVLRLGAARRGVASTLRSASSQRRDG